MEHNDAGLDTQIASWTDYLRARQSVSGPDIDELENHLRDQIADLIGSGLSDDEAFIVAIKRMGSLNEVSREFAREHSDRLWKQLVMDEPDATPRRGRRFTLVLALAVAAAVAVKIPALFGLTIIGEAMNGSNFYLLNTSLLVLPFLAAFFAVSRRLRPGAIVVGAATFAVIAVLLNSYPFGQSGVTQLLAAGFAVVVLWLAVGVAYTGGSWRSDSARMDFIRFTGEWVVYFTLIALGGALLISLTVGAFSAIGIDTGMFISEWLLPCGAAGAVIVAAGLVESKQSVIENIAPVLTKLFTPLFTAMLLALIVAAIIQWDFTDSGRTLLFISDVVLVVVLGLLLYSLSARDPQRKSGWFETLQLVMVLSALVVDVFVLAAMVARIDAFGFSANRVASLGLNIILLVNLAWSAYLLFGIVRKRVAVPRLERWQTRYIPVYGAWALAVVVAFPPVFGYH